MKVKLIVLLLSISFISFGQLQGHLYNLQVDTTANIVVGELGLFYRPKANQEIPITLGKQWVNIMAKYEGEALIMDYARFHCHQGNAFKLNGQTYFSVVLFYDRATNDPRDDIAIVSIPFPVDEKLLLQGYGQNSSAEIAQNFDTASLGKPTYEIKQIKRVK
jgi:hypothetical protein